MSKIAIYSESGAIVSVFNGINAFVSQLAAAEIENTDNKLIEVEANEYDPNSDLGNEYFVDVASETLVKKTEFPTLLIDNGLVSNVPDNTVVIWPDEELTVESNSFELESNVSGTFNFTLIHPKYLTYKLTLDYNRP